MRATDADTQTLVQRAGWFRDCAITPIAGIGNNRVFRLEADGKLFLLKRYFQHPDDPRDRFAAERAFYTFLWNAGVRRTPAPLKWHAEERIALFEFIAGNRPEQATREMILQALNFVTETNAKRFSPEASSLPIASEACFSIREHLDRVDERVRRLQNIAPITGIDERAQAFVQEAVTPTWRTVRDEILQKSGLAFLNRTLEGSERCLSPSDFGFHNTILGNDGNLRFVDFEYAGWDDPAKLICDFFWQPAVPVPISFMDVFIEGIASWQAPDVPRRVSILLPAYQVKWCCIILNDFLPTDNTRRAYSNPTHNVLDRKMEQLDKAVRILLDARK